MSDECQGCGLTPGDLEELGPEADIAFTESRGYTLCWGCAARLDLGTLTCVQCGSGDWPRKPSPGSWSGCPNCGACL